MATKIFVVYNYTGYTEKRITDQNQHLSTYLLDIIKNSYELDVRERQTCNQT